MECVGVCACGSVWECMGCVGVCGFCGCVWEYVGVRGSVGL